jgi:CubicO group peptidase (beta-lactamase class C family)
MVAGGTLDLDRPVNGLLSSWKLPESDLTTARPVTVRHLLSHSAGLTRTGYGFDRGEGMPALADLLEGKAENPAIVVEETPGVRGVPSNSGFLVLQQALEDVSGSSLAVLAQERLFARLGMTSSAFEPVDELFLEPAVTNHGRDGAPVDGKAPLVPGAPGGLWSSAEDLGRLLAALMSSWQGRRDALLPRDLAREMLAPAVGDMALGMHFRRDGETFSVQQAGGGIGATAHVIGYPERCQGAAIVVNRDGARRIVAETLAAVGREYDWPSLPLRVTRAEVEPQALEPLVGTYAYDAAPGSTVTFSVRDGALHVEFGERDPIPLIAASESLFVWPGAALEMRFDEPVEGRVSGLSLGTAGLGGAHLTRVDAEEAADAGKKTSKE